MEEMHKLCAQISHIVSANFPGTDTGAMNKLGPPSALQVRGNSSAKSPSTEVISAQSAEAVNSCSLHRPSCNTEEFTG